MNSPRDDAAILSRKDFGFDVPEELVAQEPCDRRDQSRLLVRKSDGTLSHRMMSDLVSEIPHNTLLILNESRVIPSRLLGQLRTGGKVEIFLLRHIGPGDVWEALGRPMRKLKQGTQVLFPGGMQAECLARDGETLRVKFSEVPGGFHRWIEEHGFIPLPPYIKRDDPVPASRSPDKDRYQTVYAKGAGSVAAPTAGLHFTEEILAALRGRGVEIASVCLHVGGGTFLPVKSENLDEHPMHTETYMMPATTLNKIDQAVARGTPVVAVGTTTLRCMESFFLHTQSIASERHSAANQWLSTDLFIRPHRKGDKYRPWALTGLMTNFHQPYSTLYMLVSALLGFEDVRTLYQEAIAQRYRLFSYGDTSLLWL